MRNELTHAAATTIQTPTCAVSYFAGYASAEAYAFGSASTEQIVRAFSRAVAAKKVARESFRAFSAGWVTCQSMGGQS